MNALCQAIFSSLHAPWSSWLSPSLTSASIAADHRGMCRFKNKSNQEFRNVVSELKRWAPYNLSKVNIEMGFLDEAKEALTWGVTAREGSLSKDHLGVLMGARELSRVYARQDRLDEAEKLSVETIALVAKSCGAAHPDCMFGLWKLAQL
jgi:hypothetical protein